MSFWIGFAGGFVLAIIFFVVLAVICSTHIDKK